MRSDCKAMGHKPCGTNGPLLTFAMAVVLGLLLVGGVGAETIEALLETPPSWEAERAPISAESVNQFLSDFHHLTLTPHYIGDQHFGYAISLSETSPASQDFLINLGLQEQDILLQINAVVLRSVMNLETALDVLTRAH